MTACTICGLAACGLASHKGIADPRDVSKGYAIVKAEETRQEILRKHEGNLVLAERAEARLSELRKVNAMTTYEQAVSVVLGEDPDLYQP